jgi:hypothetical protein
MLRWCLRRLRLLGLVLLVPPVLWCLAVTLMPTGWARDRLVAALERETGRSIQLEAVRLGLLGGVHLRGLEVAQPGKPSDPWLTADVITIDVHAAELLAGRIEPGRVEAIGVVLRVRRDADGDLEIGDLLRRGRATPAEDPDRAGRPDSDESDVAWRLADGRLSVVDEPTGTLLEFTQVEGQGTWRRDRTTAHDLHGRLNGGRFLLEADVERGLSSPMFEGELHTRNVELGRGMHVLRYVVPILGGPSVDLAGRLDLNLYLRGQGDSSEELTRSLVGRGAVRIDPITLEGSRVLAELGQVFHLPQGARVGAVGGDFEITGGRVGSQNLRLEAGTLPIVLDGWTDFSGRVDYRVRARGLSHALSSELRAALEDLPLGVDDVLDLRLRGEPGHLELTLDGLPLTARPDGRPPDQKDRLREAARRLRDRLLR